MQFDLLETRDESLEGTIGLILRQYNTSTNPAFFHRRDSPEHLARPLTLVVRDAADAVVAGLIAQTQFLWLKIDILAVAEPLRRRGIGRQLMERAQQVAAARGCDFAFVDTMDYQAPAFYLKLGYQVAGTLENWDSHGHTKFFFTRRLR